jgi:hypothetical protein
VDREITLTASQVSQLAQWRAEKDHADQAIVLRPVLHLGRDYLEVRAVDSQGNEGPARILFPG